MRRVQFTSHFFEAVVVTFPQMPVERLAAYVAIAYLLLGLIARAEGLQERWRLGILHKLALFGCSSFLCGPALYP